MYSKCKSRSCSKEFDDAEEVWHKIERKCDDCREADDDQKGEKGKWKAADKENAKPGKRRVTDRIVLGRERGLSHALGTHSSIQ